MWGLGELRCHLTWTKERVCCGRNDGINVVVVGPGFRLSLFDKMCNYVGEGAYVRCGGVGLWRIDTNELGCLVCMSRIWCYNKLS